MTELFAPVLSADMEALLGPEIPGRGSLERSAALFRAEGGAAPRSEFLEWEKLLAFSLAAHEIPGGHFRLLKYPAPAAPRIRRALSALGPTRGAP